MSTPKDHLEAIVIVLGCTGVAPVDAGTTLVNVVGAVGGYACNILIVTKFSLLEARLTTRFKIWSPRMSLALDQTSWLSKARIKCFAFTCCIWVRSSAHDCYQDLA